MKRLFEVNGEYFADKVAAKAARGEPIKQGITAEPGVFGSKTVPPQYKFEVRLGPDHWKLGGQLPGAKPAAVKRTRRKTAA
jgi:hypothetical protein